MNASIPELAPMLKALVESPSVSSADARFDQSNRAVVDHLASWLDDLGFSVEISPLPDQPHKANLVAVLGRGADGLVLAGHTDTVPCDPELWNSDPFAMGERDDRFYGLGTCDMKGFFPLALEAVRDVRAEDLERPLIVVATADEECSMDGARLLVERGTPAARFAVVGEPTDLRPQRLHKGIMFEKIRVSGRSGHSSDPSLGANALDAMHAVMGEIIAFRAELAASHQHPAFAVEVPTMNLGCLHAGDNPNRICGHAELQIDVRVLPGMDNAFVHEALCHRLQPVARAHDVEIEVEVLHAAPPFEEGAGGELIRLVEKLTGVEAGAVAFGTEAPFYQQLGMEAVVLGPGSIDQAHQPDEYLDHRQIEPTVRLLRDLVRTVCS
ncbi:MAG: acetylornithine deacetylase [Pseudomonadales bacterium]|jgi:acetylornithine deacetylase|nr:acetylornithine deacetylase [Pseudomonadales bacterium]